MIVMLVFAILSYFVILVGLTVWLDRYHYYKNNYFDGTTIKNSGNQSANELSNSTNNHENSHCHNVKRGGSRRFKTKEKKSS
jgi:hypothetical protein